MSAHAHAENQFVEQPVIALLDAPVIGIGAACSEMLYRPHVIIYCYSVFKASEHLRSGG
jgi:hypothetical protein